MEKLDLKKELKSFYSAKKTPEIIDVPPGNFLAVTGRGEPGGELFEECINALYGLSYTAKFKSKDGGMDFTVMGLEGLWWWDDTSIIDLEDAPPRDEWNFELMIRQPDFITPEMIDELRPGLIEKKGPKVNDVEFITFHEGLCAHMMHIGSYSEEAGSQKVLHGFIDENGYKLRGKHHEIYLGNPRRTAPENLKTILRHPIEKT